MSTYYAFKCKKCKELGGFLSRQAWGWSNFEPIDTFKFIAYHISHCGEENISIISEEDTDYNLPNTNYADDLRLKFLVDTKHYFPGSNDWEFMGKNKDNPNDKWIELQIKDIKDNSHE